MTRIHLSTSKELSKDQTYLPGEAPDYLFKPNGLWYALYDDGDDWAKKLRAESQTGYDYTFELYIDFDNVCLLDNMDAVLEFHRRYSFKSDLGFSAIDWEKVKMDYAGIELQNYEKLSVESAYYGIIWMKHWAMDGGCIWDLRVVEWEKL